MNSLPYSLKQILTFINAEGKNVDEEILKASAEALHDAIFGLVRLDKEYFDTLPNGSKKLKKSRKNGQRGTKHDMSKISIDHPVFSKVKKYVCQKISYEDVIGEIEEEFNVTRSTANTYLNKLKPRARKTTTAIEYLQKLIKEDDSLV